MSADSPYLVKVLKLIEAEIVIYAVTSADAIEEARRLPDVAKVVEANPLLDLEG